MVTMTQENKMIAVEVLPNDVTRSLPAGFAGPRNSGEGFSDKTLAIPYGDGQITYMISYDGEGELLASILTKPATVSEEAATDLLKGFFMQDDSDEDEEDNDDDEGEDEDEE